MLTSIFSLHIYVPVHCKYCQTNCSLSIAKRLYFDLIYSLWHHTNFTNFCSHWNEIRCGIIAGVAIITEKAPLCSLWLWFKRYITNIFTTSGNNYEVPRVHPMCAKAHNYMGMTLWSWWNTEASFDVHGMASSHIIK